MTRLFFLLTLFMWGLSGPAQAGAPVARVVAGQVLAADSLRTHTLELIARGQLQEAIDYWVLSTGEEAPKWLLAAKVAFDASKQVAGACQGVARTVYSAFTQLGGKPELVELKTSANYVMFKTVDGRDLNVTRTGYHVLVRMGGRAYDAFTGAAGMPWSEYMSRLGARAGFTETVVESVP